VSAVGQRDVRLVDLLHHAARVARVAGRRQQDARRTALAAETGRLARNQRNRRPVEPRRADRQRHAVPEIDRASVRKAGEQFGVRRAQGEIRRAGPFPVPDDLTGVADEHPLFFRHLARRAGRAAAERHADPVERRQAHVMARRPDAEGGRTRCDDPVAVSRFIGRRGNGLQRLPRVAA